MHQFALIGAGRWGEKYIHAINSIKNCKLSYVCIPSPENNHNLNGDYTVIKDYKELGRFSDIDGVIIVTPIPTHFQIAKFFLEKKYNLLIEKPLASSYKDALKLLASSKNSSSVVMVSNIYSYNSRILEIQKLKKKIGKVFFIDSAAGKDFGFVPGREMSALWEWAPHDISICNFLLGEAPVAVSAWAVGSKNKEKAVCLKLIYPQGVTAFVKVGWLFPQKLRFLSMTGQLGSLGTGNDENLVLFHDKAGKSKNIKVRKNDSLRMQIEEFSRRIKEEDFSNLDITKGFEVVKILHFAQKSIALEGKKVDID